MFRNKTIILILSIIFTVSCRKKDQITPVFSQVQYFDLKSQSVSDLNELNLDLDRNGTSDFLFRVHKVAYDNNSESRLEFCVYSTGTGKVAINTADETTTTFSKGKIISSDNFSGFEWLSANRVILMQQSIKESAIRWTGNFLTSDEVYFPVLVSRESKSYCAWLQLKADTANKQLRLLRAAVAMEPDKPILAGL